MAKKKAQYKKKSKPVSVRCVALIPLDTAKIKKDLLKAYRRKKKAFEKLENQLQQYNEQDITEYQKYLAQHFGPEMSRQREFHEKIHLTESRTQLIFHMASEKGMSRARYCYHLKCKVTDELDFWAVLDQEYQQFIEEMRRKEEDFRQAYSEIFEDDDDESDDDWDFEGDDDFNDFDFEKIFDELFEDGNPFKDAFRGMNDLFSNKQSTGKSDYDELKKLYRELCLRYHPDRNGEHDAKTKHIWISIQEAYQEKDIERLRTIHTGIELELNPESATISCSELSEILDDLEYSSRKLKSDLRYMKKSPAWGFTTLKSAKRQELERSIRSSFQNDLYQMEQYLNKCEKDLHHLMNQYKPKLPKKKPIQEEQVPQSDKIQHEFNF